MAQAALPSPSKADKRNIAGNLVPPDEKFWKHYSPHGEFPLSSVGSLVIHLLVFGLMILMGWLAVVLFDQGSKSLPVEAVRLDLGGGGGNRRGSGDGPNNGATPQEVGSEADERPKEKQPDNVPPPEIKVDPNPQVPKFENDPKRQIQESDSNSKAFSDLRNKAASIRMPGAAPSGYGKGGTGSGGGSGSGKGKGIGSGTGDGPGNLTKREKRQSRWTLLFNVENSNDYVAQMQGLGAYLAIPVRQQGDHFEYKIVRNLSVRPAKMSNEEGQQIESMMRWRSVKPQDAIGVISVLGLPAPKIAPEEMHFLACLPEKLEQRLLRMEMDYLHKRHPSFGEDNIASTVFRLKVRGGKYEPEVAEQELNK